MISLKFKTAIRNQKTQEIEQVVYAEIIEVKENGSEKTYFLRDSLDKKNVYECSEFHLRKWTWIMDSEMEKEINYLNLMAKVNRFNLGLRVGKDKGFTTQTQIENARVRLASQAAEMGVSVHLNPDVKIA